MAESLLRIIKLGGSLLDLDGLHGALRRWLSTQPPADNVFIVGGGALVDSLRQADRRHGLGDEASHWLAIHAMDVTARLLNAIMPEASLVDWLQRDAPRQVGCMRILLPFKMLDELDSRRGLTPLPHSWNVTSDSIAAWLASVLRAEELVLLKSRLPCATGGDDDLVDPYFRRAARDIATIRCVNLRDAAYAERRL